MGIRISYKKHSHLLAVAGYIVAIVAVMTAYSLYSSRDSTAADLANFDPGRIMDDSVFYDRNTMTAAHIQAFLNGKVGSCDTQGTQAYGTTTRAAYSATRGYYPPFTCIKDYSQTTTTKAADAYCAGYTASSQTAAQIIYGVAQSCGINPQVLIVLLQKEQGLITDTWPWSIQYRSATGMGCPDTAACDSQYYGFFNQLYSAARQFKLYQAFPNSYSYVAGRNNTILWNPNSSCGSSTVYIQNQATAGLYNYTPYRPNTAALAAGYGSGDGCSAYGNRNFWLYFNDWFGGTTGPEYAWQYVGQDAFIDSSRTQRITSKTVVAPQGTIYLSVRAKNMGRTPWTSSVKLGTSRQQDRSSIFANSGWPASSRAAILEEERVNPGEIGTFLFSITAPKATGTYKEYFNLVAEGKAWLNDVGLHFSIDVTNPITARNSQKTGLSSGQSIKANEYLLSPDTYTTLSLEANGNMVQRTTFSTVWQTNTSNSSGDRLIMQSDGNLVLYNKNNVAMWNSQTSGNSGARLVLQTDGNVVIYSPTNVALWSTGIMRIPDHLRVTTSDMKTSSVLYVGQMLETSDRRYRLVLQSDGNLVLYKDGRALWSTGTVDKASHRLVLQSDGNLVLYTNNNAALWSSGAVGRASSVLRVQLDGNLVLYNTTGDAALWHTHTNNK